MAGQGPSGLCPGQADLRALVDFVGDIPGFRRMAPASGRWGHVSTAGPQSLLVLVRKCPERSLSQETGSSS